jgi:dihydrofolate reductase
MRKIISFMHMSLDGFVAGPKGEMDWITINEEIFNHIETRISECDTALYGRNTYEMMQNYWPTATDKPNASRHDIEHSKWYANVHKVVLSKTMDGTDLNNTIVISHDLSEDIRKVKNVGNGMNSDILLFGSPMATHSLMQQNLIDGFWLFVNPIILGQGIPLFEGIKDKIKLKLLNTKQFNCGVTELNYTVDRL